MTLRERFFMAINRQDTITFPVFNSEDNITAKVFGVNEPYVSTDHGDIYIKWWDTDNQIPPEWFKKVYESGFTTLVVFPYLLPTDPTEDQLDYLTRDGAFLYGDTKINVYARVY